VGDPDAQCCDSLSGGTKKCYNPNDCFECKEIDPNTRVVVNKCTDPEQSYYHEGKTSCCFGECYDNRCDRCEGTSKINRSIVPNYNTSQEVCCAGVKRSKDRNIKDSCKGCKDIPTSTIINNKTINYVKKEIVENTCLDDSDPGNPDCCYGNCWDSAQTICSKCDDSTKTVKTQCPPTPDSPLIACCGGTCWLGTDRDPCHTCSKVNGNDVLVSTPNCSCCSNTNGSIKVCCPPVGEPSQTACCISSGECYNPECERCY
jgi:hypothetical protein